MKSLLLLVGSFGGWLVVGLAVMLPLERFVGQDIAAAIGTGLWILGGLTTLQFGSIWLADDTDFDLPPSNPTTIAERQRVRHESKLRSAELRGAFVFGLVGYGMVMAVKGPHWLAALIATPLAIFGGGVGFLFKRWFLARRQEK